jgi:WD40 repeat protein
VRSAAFTPDGRLLVSGGQDGKVRFWDSQTFAPRGRPLAHGEAVVHLAVSPDGRRLCTTSLDGRGRLWSLPDGRPVAEVSPPDPIRWRPTQALFSPDGAALLLMWRWKGGGPGRADVWRAADGRLLGTAPHGEVAAGIACVHPRGQTYLTTSDDGFGRPERARLWDLKTNRAVGAAVPFSVSAGAAAFHPSGRFVALGLFEGQARLWSPAVSAPIGPPVRHPGPVGAVAFTPDGRLLATAGADGTIRLWAVPAPLGGTPAQVRAGIEALVGQELDEAGGAQDLNDAQRAQRRRRAQPPG